MVMTAHTIIGKTRDRLVGQEEVNSGPPAALPKKWVYRRAANRPDHHKSTIPPTLTARAAISQIHQAEESDRRKTGTAAITL